MRRLLALAPLLASALVAPAGAGGPGVRDLLPNLVAAKTRALYLGTPDDYFVNGANQVVHGCTPYEVANEAAARCLRFETIVVNRGSGPLEMRYRYDQAATSHGAMQRIYRSNGTYADRSAGSYEIEPAHAHVHYAYFALARLWRSTAKGKVVGKAALREGQKEGFCLEDMENHDEGREPPIPPRYTWPTACYPVVSGTEVSQVNGISVGWADIYGMALPHQYVEVSGVPDGYYLLQIVVNPVGKLRETTARDNSVWQRVRICGDRADLVGVTQRCP